MVISFFCAKDAATKPAALVGPSRNSSWQMVVWWESYFRHLRLYHWNAHLVFFIKVEQNFSSATVCVFLCPWDWKFETDQIKMRKTKLVLPFVQIGNIANCDTKSRCRITRFCYSSCWIILFTYVRHRHTNHFGFLFLPLRHLTPMFNFVTVMSSRPVLVFAE